MSYLYKLKNRKALKFVFSIANTELSNSLGIPRLLCSFYHRLKQMSFFNRKASFLPDWQLAAFASVYLAPLDGHLTLRNYGTEYYC